MKTLFSLIESPFHPNFSALYQKLGVTEERFDSARNLHRAMQKQRRRIFSWGNSFTAGATEGALWEDFLDDVRKALGVELYTALSNCEVTLLTDSCLEIRPALQLFRKRLEQATVLDRVSDVAVARFGEGFDVRLAREGELPAPDSGKPPISLQLIESERQKRIEKAALDDPTVKAAMDLFAGKVDKIQRLDE